ncbi:MAG: FecR domain-containing protein [Holophagae bacterium]|jgi:hypothetical protein
MRPLVLIVVALVAVVAGASGPEAPTAIDYEVTAVKRVFLAVGDETQHQLSVGDALASGQRLRTGSRSSANLRVDEFEAEFHISAKTACRLAAGVPGVLLEVDLGSVRGAFWPLKGDRERLVVTPSAVLAVRGTEYGLSVNKKGATTVTVFRGLVELRSREHGAGPLQLRAGQASRIRKGHEPASPWAHGLTTGDWDRGRRPSLPSGAGNSIRSSTSGSQPRAGGTGSKGNQQPPSGSRRHGG